MTERAAPELRPLTTPEAVNAAVVLVQRAAARYYALACVGTIPVVLLTLGYLRWAGTLVRGQEEGVFIQGTTLWAVGMAAAWMLLSVSRGAVTAAALADARGDPASARDCWRAALRRAPTLALVGSASAACAWLTALALLPVTAWFVARPVAMEDGQPFTSALVRSSTLTKGYRGKAFRLWLLFVLIWAAGLVNLYLVVSALLGLANTLFGYEVGAWEQALSYQNRAYVVWLGALLFALLDPLKTCADAALYLDLRIRREGADLQERLRALARQAAAGTGTLLALLALLVAARPAGAETLSQYREQVRQVRLAVQRAPGPEEARAALSPEVTAGSVQMPDGQTVAVDNGWMGEGLSHWKSEADRQRLLRRLEALERSLDRPGAVPPPADRNPDGVYKQVIARPEFQELADRPELGRLAKELRPEHAGTWFERLWRWIKTHLQKAAQPNIRPIRAPNWNPRLGQRVLYGLLALAGALLLALILKALFQRWQERPSRKATPAAPPALEESHTENALDHTVDEWEEFAREWLRRGDLRQAVRALYLALLVELHQRRQIDYNRAFTNWRYVREFNGQPEQRQTLRGLTEVFDRVWYGRFACAREEFDRFERGVRGLVIPGAGGGPAHA